MKIMVEISERLKDIADKEDEKSFSDFAYVVMDSIKNGIPLDSIIADIEAARDKDKLCEYPYVRCVEIIKKAMGHEEKTMDEGNK